MALADINNIIRANRLQRFKTQIEQYWDVDDLLFNVCFLFVIGASDNFAKNFYPYTFGGKYRLRNDDLDTIKPTDNQGADRKPYYVEWFDKDASGNYYVNAADGGFIRLIWDAYFTGAGSRGYTMMQRVLGGLEALGGSATGLHLDRLMAWNEKYYNKVKDYFPATLVNDDMARYERARIASNKGLYSEVDPLTQELGDHKSTENSWMKKRFIYLQSMFSYGDFASGASGTITFRLLNASTFSLTPAITMYPSAAAGSSVVRGDRTMAGDVCSLYISGSDLDCSILGANYLSDIGDWHNVPVRNNPSFNARMLKRLILGTPNATYPKSIDITGLTLNCPSLQELDVRNITNLSGQIDLTGSTIIKTVLAGGTNVSRFSFADGAPLETLELPRSYQQIVLRDMATLENGDINYGVCADNITRFLISNCANMSPIKMLSDIIEAQKTQAENHVLQRVYVDGFYEEINSPAVLDNIVLLADGYLAMNRQEADIAGAVPILSGTIVCTKSVYQDTVDTLLETFGPGGLNIITEGGVYIRFEDTRILEICAYNWGDTYDLQEVNGQGGVVAYDELEGNDDTLVYSPYYFASSQEITAHSGIAATAASAHRYRIEITVEGGRALDGENAPWDIATASATTNEVFYPVQYSSAMAAVALGAITAENWADSTFWAEQTILENGGAVGSTAYKYIATVTTTTAAQYLRLGIRALSGVSVSFKIVTLDVTKMPSGITLAQCQAVTSLSTKFAKNSLITKFNELQMFTAVTLLAPGSFTNCAALMELDCRNITGYTGSSTLIQMFNGCTSLYRLILSKWSTFGAAGNVNASRDWLGNCTSLTRLILPSVVSFHAISNGNTSGVTMVDLGPNYTTTNNASSSGYNFNSTKTVIVRAETPPSLGTSVTIAVRKLYVPADSVDLYKAAERWSARASVTYAIGGAEWIAEFGSSDEYANLTEQEYVDTYGWLEEQE